MEKVKIIFMMLSLIVVVGYVSNHSKSGWPALAALFAWGWIFQKLGWVKWNIWNS